MFKRPVKHTPENIPKSIGAPVGGLNAYTSVMSMPEKDAILLNNFLPLPAGLEMRPGYTSHITDFAATPYRLAVYSKGDGTEKLFGMNDSGIYDCTTAGAAPAASIALTDGKTSSTILATGANTYMVVVNGTDTLKLFDGTTWTSVATFNAGAYSTAQLDVVETYRQRLYFAQRNSLILYYLAVNTFPALANTATSYDLGALFRQGGYIVSLGTWTIDGGVGPEDQLAVVTSKGEVAIFSGSDPSSASTWSLRGIYYIGKPLGGNCLYKYGGDLLFLSENGLYPLSQATQSTAIERTNSITDKVRQVFNEAAQNYSTNEGWQVIAQPNLPILVVNVPATPLRQQIVMHAQTGAWATFTGWEAYAFARMGTTLYFSTTTGVMRVTGVSDNGANITATMVQAPSRLNYSRLKQIVHVKPYFVTTGNFSYSIGVANDFKTVQEASLISQSGLGGLPLWGTAIWGSAVWAGSSNNVQDWQEVADDFSMYKSLYLQVVSNVATITYYGSDLLLLPGGN